MVRGIRNAFAVLVVSYAAVMLGAAPAAAATWKLATDQALDSPEGRSYVKFVELVDKYSGGELKVEIFPYAQLGGEDAVLEQLSAGLVQINPNATSSAQKWVPDVKYVSAPFLFTDWDHWNRFMNSDMVKAWYGQLEDKVGVTVIGDPTEFLRGPYRVIVSKKPIKNLENLAGVKLRLHNDDLAVAAWQYLGADVRLLNWNEVYDGLNRGLVEAFNAPVSQVESTHAWEVAKNVGRQNEYWQGVAFYANADAYNGLDPKLKEAVDRAYSEAAAYATDLVTSGVTDSLKRLADEGVEYREIDTSGFVSRMQQFYAERNNAGELPGGFMDAVEATR